MSIQTAGKKMLTGIAGLAICASLAMPGFAMMQDQAAPPQQQEQGGPHGRGGRGMMDPDRQAKHMARELGLSGDQEAQLKPILVDRDQQIQALRADTSTDGQDRHAKMKSIMDASNSKIEAILNDQQKQKFTQMQAERMQRMQQHRKGGDAAAGDQGTAQPQ